MAPATGRAKPAGNDWAAIAAVLLRGVSRASDRQSALGAWQAATAHVQVRGDVWALGNELEALRPAAPNRRDRELTRALAMCVYKAAAPFSPILPYLYAAVALIAGVAAVLALATHELALGVIECAGMAVFGTRARTLREQLRHLENRERLAPPSAEPFLRLRAVRRLPERRV